MKNKKTLLVITFLCFLSLTYILGVFAHSGRTDANGGHWNRKTGTYHYHSGGSSTQPSTSSDYSIYSDYDTYSDYAPTYTDRYDEGYDIGYDDGLSDGKVVGYDDGYSEGYDDGYDDGHDDGYDDGYDKGYQEGEESGIAQKTPLDKFLMYYTPTSIAILIFLCFKLFSK